MEEVITKTSEVKIGDVNRTIYWTKSSKDNSPSPTLDEQEKYQKLLANSEKQKEEIADLESRYPGKFQIVPDENTKPYSLSFHLRGGREALLTFKYPPDYPSDMPPEYTFSAPWMREKQRKALFHKLANSYSENFGKCVIGLWAEKILSALKEENAFLKNHDHAPEALGEEQNATPNCVEEEIPGVYVGKPIWDRESCFSPYLAKVTSEEEIRQVIELIESCRKVATAWRNTYAFRYRTPDGRIIELGEDGGEPKAGRNLLERLIKYDACDLLVYISRRVGGRLLGSDRFRHLNDTADDVLIACGYKNVSETRKDSCGSKKKDKKSKKKK